ncbi:MAG: hypothetical protein OEM58_12490 [Nitrospirota bacterium]|nr:hypothetical protein [Nitrospirota bacterium]
MRGDQLTQRETKPFEEETVSNMWEIAEALKLDKGVGRRVSTRLRLGSDPSLALVLSEVEWIRMTMREVRWMPDNNCRA